MNKIFRAAVHRDATVDIRSKNQQQDDENTQEDRHQEQVKCVLMNITHVEEYTLPHNY
jgi:hypothetical protein